MEYQHKTEDQIKTELTNGKKTHETVQAGKMSSAHLREQFEEIQEEVNKICSLPEGKERNERKQTVFNILNVLKQQLAKAIIQTDDKGLNNSNGNLNNNSINNKQHESSSNNQNLKNNINTDDKRAI